MGENSILDRHNYNTKTKEVYEIMAAYYVDIFYNHLYNEAKKLKEGGSVSSITDGYKHTLNAFLKSLTNAKLYNKNIIGIHNYYINIGFASISFAKCVDKLTAEFIPTDYTNSLSSTQKMGVLRMVINQSMKVFIRNIVDNHIAKIIDNHTDRDNVRILQDILVDCFILEREGMYQRFIADKTKTNKDETVNRLIAEKMQTEIKKLIKEKYESKKHILMLKKAYIIKKESENKKNEIIAELQTTIQSFQQKINHLKSQNNNYNKQTHESPVQQTYEAPVQQTHESPVQQTHEAPVQQTHEAPVQQTHEAPSQQTHESSIISVKNLSVDDIVSDDSDDDTSNFIEVNKSNMDTVINGDSEYLQQLNDNKSFNMTMDEGTSLEDFA